ncbi:diaminopimelate decarboxylase family protein [Vibrio hangzhouensis]|uniref:diaminopimelate decarboxylase family protein n=1 Tax=Vibrio hangzhouensis TaxID=462991 RepID=UPI001C98B760|nr:alanine racemase [Vibrio hangzhouensis]MBY6197358.1 alanine racemase [Vibrio hangzhouensis]
MEVINDSLSIRNGRLFIEDCDAAELAQNFGTPLFVVSETHLRNNLRRYKAAFESCWPEGNVCIMPAFKANPITAVRKILSDEGCGCDIFGASELEGALRGGVPAKDISVNGSIKDRATIRRAIEVGARIVLDSPNELEICQQEAKALNKPARVMFRLKPFMENLTLKSDFAPDFEIRELTQLIKYGVPTSELLPMGPRAMELSHIEPIGIHVHMGRHSKQLEVWQAWVYHCVMLTKELSDLMGGWSPKHIDFGGGFPSFPDTDTDVMIKRYEGPELEEYAQVITDTLRDTMNLVGLSCKGVVIEVEPGRGLHCDTGIHLTTVKNTKFEQMNRPRRWAELDTSEVFLGIPGLNEEPPFDYIFANKCDLENEIETDLVGQTCNAELLFNQVKAPTLESGDVIALLNTGAYTEPMAANFNALPRPGTLLVCGSEADMIKRHETINEVYSRDELPIRVLDRLDNKREVGHSQIA